MENFTQTLRKSTDEALCMLLELPEHAIPKIYKTELITINKMEMEIPWVSELIRIVDQVLTDSPADTNAFNLNTIKAAKDTLLSCRSLIENQICALLSKVQIQMGKYATMEINTFGLENACDIMIKLLRSPKRSANTEIQAAMSAINVCFLSNMNKKRSKLEEWAIIHTQLYCCNMLMISLL